MRYILIILILLISKIVSAELFKPNPGLLPEDVISIQLVALQNNNIPYKDAGIEQTWEFAHPINRKFTGPLPKFISMMNTSAYSMMLNHFNHNIIFIQQNEIQSLFFIEMIDNNGNKVGFQWIVEKVQSEDKYNNCWMTTGVSLPMDISNSA